MLALAGVHVGVDAVGKPGKLLTFLSVRRVTENGHTLGGLMVSNGRKIAKALWRMSRVFGKSRRPTLADGWPVLINQ